MLVPLWLNSSGRHHHVPLGGRVVLHRRVGRCKMGSSSSLLQIFASSAAPLACFDVVLLQLDGAIFLMREREREREERSSRGD